MVGKPQFEVESYSALSVIGMIQTKAVLPISLRGNAKVDAGLLTPNRSVAELSVICVISARIHSWHNFGPFEHVFLGVMVLHVLYFLAWIVSMGNVVAFGSRTVMVAAPRSIAWSAVSSHS